MKYLIIKEYNQVMFALLTWVRMHSFLPWPLFPMIPSVYPLLCSWSPFLWILHLWDENDHLNLSSVGERIVHRTKTIGIKRLGCLSRKDHRVPGTSQQRWCRLSVWKSMELSCWAEAPLFRELFRMSLAFYTDLHF